MRIQNFFATRNFTKLLLVFFIFTANAFSQTPAATPDTETIRVSSDLIQTNVTVVDKSGHFVDGLKREQFELRVDGKPVPINFFDKFAAQASEKQQTVNSLSSGAVAENSLRLGGRKIIFFVDDLHLSLSSLNQTRSAINHFIDAEMMPRDNVLIVSASGQIGFLQQFTDNKTVLRAALARLKFFPFVTRDSEAPPMPEFTALRILNGDKEVADYYVEQIFKGFNVKNFRGINYNGALEMVRNRANNIVSALTSVSESSLNSLESLLQTLNQTEGRKLIFFTSDGFFLGSKNNSPVDNVRLQRVVDSATRSGSVIYTIDARGLFSLAISDATGERPADPQGRFDKGRVSEEMLSQEALFTLADETGGQFLKNQNYFDKWIDKTLAQNSNYYVLAWSPDKELPTDKKFRRVEVSVIGQPDLTVRLQRGYISGAERLNGKTADASQSKQKSNKPNSEKLLASTVAADRKNLPLTLSLHYLDVPNVGAVLTSSVQITTKDLDYSGSAQAANVDVAGVVFNDQGKQVADFKTGLKVASSAQNTAYAGGQSVIYNNRTPLAPGIYQVRVGARESKTGQTGTSTQWIEIPDLTKQQLTLGSLLLGIKAVKNSEKPEDLQIQFSVDHQFGRPLQLDFMSFIYNAARTPSGDVNLATKVEIYDAHGRAIVNTASKPLSAKGITDLSRVPFSGAIRQQTSLPGSYLLRITVQDLAANTSAVKEAIFTIE